MTASTTSAPLARVQLARDARTTLALPALLFVLGVAAAGAAVMLLPTGGPMFALGGAGLVLALVGLTLAARVRSLRLAVEPDYLHLTGLGVDRRYHLAPGALSRLPTAGPKQVSLRTRPTSLGFAVGRATLSGGERVEVIRLGASPSVILVPTERGRVALAAAAEAELVEALMAAARTRAARPSPPPQPAAGATVASPAVTAPTAARTATAVA
ncbi:MAG TPA: hypothetical protein VJ839_03340, partial [Candidatus Limnocylindria bacterium]|nr:hypothetical protein [Candidatus Limnocylindria bacterium]